MLLLIIMLIVIYGPLVGLSVLPGISLFKTSNEREGMTSVFYKVLGVIAVIFCLLLSFYFGTIGLMMFDSW